MTDANVKTSVALALIDAAKKKLEDDVENSIRFVVEMAIQEEREACARLCQDDPENVGSALAVKIRQRI